MPLLLYWVFESKMCRASCLSRLCTPFLRGNRVFHLALPRVENPAVTTPIFQDAYDTLARTTRRDRGGQHSSAMHETPESPMPVVRGLGRDEGRQKNLRTMCWRDAKGESANKIRSFLSRTA